MREHDVVAVGGVVVGELPVAFEFEPARLPDYDATAGIAVQPLVDRCTHPWHNQTLCQVNDSVVRLGVVKGEYHWHQHEQEDEFFYVVEGRLIIDLDGEITAGAEAALQAVYEQATREGGPAIVLNFAGVDYINSSGIALIVTLLSRARGEGRRLLASGLSEHYVEIFQITRLADFLTICAEN